MFPRFYRTVNEPLCSLLNFLTPRRGKKTGGKGAGIGTFQNGEAASCLAPVSAYAAGVEEKKTVHSLAPGSMGMAEQGRVRPSVPRNDAYRFITFLYIVTAAVR